MQRLSAVGVQPVTVAGGLALGSRFELGKQGIHNMDVTLKNLSGVFGYEKLLYYGFGYRSFVNVLAETKVGVNLVALCACLVDMHDIPFAAEVLSELWRLENFPEEFQPSMSQFNALATACAGVIAASVFGEIGDMILGDLRKLLRWTSSKDPDEGKKPPKGALSTAEDLAAALHGIFQISRGMQKQVEIVGGASCAFIGAFSQWLLNFTVHVEDDVGTLIYRDGPDQEAAQVTIRYCSTNELSSKLSILSTTYVLRNPDKMFHLDETLEMRQTLRLHVRTPWDGCLKRVFWSAAPKLMQLTHIFGKFLGSAARLYAAFARGEPQVEQQFSGCRFLEFIEGAHGRGFIESLSNVLPELGRVEGLNAVMIDALNVSYQQAFANLEETINSLIRLCECDICSKRFERYDSLKDSTKVLPEIHDCLLTTAATILSTVRLVAGLSIHGTINPTISGLQSIFESRDSNIRPTYVSDSESPPDIRCVLGVYSDTCVIRSNRIPTVFLEQAQSLFAGRPPNLQEDEVDGLEIASSSNGICCYIEALNGLSCDAAVLRRVHVLPGRIQRGNREYNEVMDFQPTFETGLPAAKLNPSNANVPTKFINASIDVKGIVREVPGTSALGFYFGAQVEGKAAIICPGLLTERVLSRTFIVPCNKKTCPKSLVFPCRVVQAGWDILAAARDGGSANPDCVIWPFQESHFGRCLAVVAEAATWGYPIYIRKGACLPCVTKGLAKRRDDRSQII